MKVLHLTQEHAHGLYNLCGEGDPTPRDYVEAGDEVVCLECARTLSKRFKYLNSMFSQYHEAVMQVTTATADVMEAWETGHKRTDTTPHSALLASTMDAKALMESGQSAALDALISDLEERLRERGK